MTAIECWNLCKYKCPLKISYCLFSWSFIMLYLKHPQKYRVTVEGFKPTSQHDQIQIQIYATLVSVKKKKKQIQQCRVAWSPSTVLHNLSINVPFPPQDTELHLCCLPEVFHMNNDVSIDILSMWRYISHVRVCYTGYHMCKPILIRQLVFGLTLCFLYLTRYWYKQVWFINFNILLTSVDIWVCYNFFP